MKKKKQPENDFHYILNASYKKNLALLNTLNTYSKVL